MDCQSSKCQKHICFNDWFVIKTNVIKSSLLKLKKLKIKIKKK